MLLYTLFFSYRTRNVIFLTQAGTDTGGHCTRAHTHIHTLSLTHTHLFFCLSLSSPPPKQQKSEHVKGKRFGMILIKTLGVNSLSELREYCFDLEPILKESIVMF